MLDLQLKEFFSRDTKGGKPFIIAGPCSAETEEQVHETVRQLAKQNVDAIRAGIWKPRTRPNSFEGIGTIGLKWLKDACKEVNLPAAVEVANAKHVYECLKFGIDILWIGARTTVNPFAVQEIADALEGADVPIMVKNPINPDLELWIGAIERLHKAGLRRIAAIHRGFSSYEKTKYRNRPYWEIPIELKRRIPNLPIICDPSHICGTRELIASVCQKAMDLNFDGLIIESHRDPSHAWSDAAQQVTPDRLSEIINNLILRRVSTDNPEFNTQLEDLRNKIDRVDDELLDILSQRMEIVKDIANCKKENNITILQPGRWDEIVKNSLVKGRKRNLSDDMITTLFQAVHKESIRKQTEIMNEE
ncbi:MAG: bifunctional 3-deoxy-7-phosphoheptulonate synthase/chorismate mutase type II [Candidatus Sericytochromatia bacterium]|nr:bifunctional 3-deoxy-7-phosphoheptulonate synthase/chorismate mutase type II [Candidatus Sericytochromatia bacterium]